VDDASSTNLSNSEDFSLLRAPSTVLMNLVAAVQLHADETDDASMAVSPQSKPNSSSNVRTFMLDSGSQINLMTLETAREFFRDQRISNLRVLGVSGTAKSADLAGHLVILVQAPDGSEHHLDLGVAH